MVLVIYDVTNDRIRGKIADVCLDYGLKRVQRSAFAGRLNSNRQGEIMQKIARVAGTATLDVRLYSICERDERLIRVLSQTSPDEPATGDAPGTRS